MKTGRNEPCHCGSGKKFKQCHGRESSSETNSQWLGWIVGTVVVAGAIAILLSIHDSGNPDAPSSRTKVATETAAPVATASIPVPARPVAPAPMPQNAAASQVKIETRTIPGSATEEFPQPPGPAPAGKVWSSEHGHWHDAATGEKAAGEVPVDLAPMIQPPGAPPAPPGLVWSKEHHHWHRADADAARRAAATGTAATSTTAPATTTTRNP